MIEINSKVPLDGILDNLSQDERTILEVFAISCIATPQAIALLTNIGTSRVEMTLSSLREKHILKRFGRRRSPLRCVIWQEDPDGERYGVSQDDSQTIYKHLTGRDKSNSAFKLARLHRPQDL